MAKSVVPLTYGFDTQARWFWLKAADLYLDENVCAVGFEVDGAQGFDDVAVYYKEPDAERASADYYQIKFRLVPGEPFTCNALIKPSFINASTISLLERLRDLQRKLAPNGTEARFIISIPTVIDPHDPLAQMVETGDGRIRWEVLRVGGANSKMGKVRASWKGCLGLTSDEELRLVLMPLRIQPDQVATLRDRVSERLQSAGWRPYDKRDCCSKYDSLPWKLLQAGRGLFTREELTEIGRREGLWVSEPRVGRPAARRVGIRSFMRGADGMAADQDEMLCLVEHFDGRWPATDDGWNEAVLPAVSGFLGRLRSDGPIHLELRCHHTVAFAAGYAVDSKSGVEVYPVQVSGARIVWRPDKSRQPGESLWDIGLNRLGDGEEMAVAISVTHDIMADVEDHVRRHLPKVGRILGIRVSGGPCSTAVRDGTHALQLAQQAVSEVRTAQRAIARGARLHLFVAAPAALAFFLGQHARVLGPCCLYEHDFARARPLAYERSGFFPLSTTD